ncbi:MAG: DUF1629 domain-containing protein [Bacteroidota bacterium]
MSDAPYLRLVTVAPTGAARYKHLEGYDRDYKLLKGRELVRSFPSDASYRMNRDFPDDLGLEDAAFNLDYQLVVSERLRAFLEAREVPGIEFLSVTMLDHKARAVTADYAIANLLTHVDCVDKEATTHEWNSLDDTAMVGVKNLTVEPDRVPDGVPLFRLVHVTDVIGVRRDLAEALQAEGFTGLTFTDFADYKG